jgi:DNA-binding transcriptional ArsR family regulator
MDLDLTFAALADPTRRAILARLTEGEASVTELHAVSSISQPAISKHLKVLENAGLVVRSRDGQVRPVKLNAKPLAAASDWLGDYRKFWDDSLANLDDYVKQLKEQHAKRSKKRRR